MKRNEMWMEMKAKHISVAGTVNLLIFLCVYVHDKTVYGEKQIEFLLLTAVGRGE